MNTETMEPTLEKSEPLSILLVEDDGDDAFVVREMLGEPSATGFDIARVDCSAKAQKHLEESSPDCVLLDLSLPDARGLEALTKLRTYAPDLPIIVLSGTEVESVAVSAVKEGAQNYLVKGRIDGRLLRRSISYAIERKHAELDLAHYAMHDSLTGLPNRPLFLDRVRQALARSRRHGYTFAIFFLDLDGFKAINDSRGHKVGDQLLVAMARRLEDVLREYDTAARFGGDEFTILCENVFDEQHAADIAERLIASIEAPITIDSGERLTITTSIGIASGMTASLQDPQVLNEVAEALVRDADLAMYRAKEQGTAFEFFDSDMRARIAERSGITRRLEDAIRREEFFLLYQPQIDALSGNISGVEALLRWQRPGHGALEPAEFLPAIEKTELIIPVGDWVLREACDQIERWRHVMSPDWTPNVAINLSQRELSHPDLVNRMRESLACSQTDPATICIEITERIAMADVNFALETLQSLKALGVTLAVDDFGTGHASLADLKRFPFDILKIDGSFVAGLGDERDSQDYEIVASTIRLAHGLGMTVVAEGVEHGDQLKHLRTMNCDVVQGYHLSRPLAAADVTDLQGRIEIE